MTPEEIQTVAAIADMLRSKGVTSFELSGPGGIRLELGPLPDSAPKDAGISAIGAAPEPDKCRCGHADYQHTNGLCSLGCEVEKCLEPEQQAAPTK